MNDSRHFEQVQSGHPLTFRLTAVCQVANSTGLFFFDPNPQRQRCYGRDLVLDGRRGCLSLIEGGVAALLSCVGGAVGLDSRRRSPAVPPYLFVCGRYTTGAHPCPSSPVLGSGRPVAAGKPFPCGRVWSCPCNAGRAGMTRRWRPRYGLGSDYLVSPLLTLLLGILGRGICATSFAGQGYAWPGTLERSGDYDRQGGRYNAALSG